MLHIISVPNDLVELWLYAVEPVGQFGNEIRPTLGEGITERRNATLQAIEFRKSTAQGGLAVAQGGRRSLKVSHPPTIVFYLFALFMS